ncbi:MAG: hypothetical protein JRN06_03350 [Nitrososphaerota archaeon]|nr:hypothetical protein [Nitrososphaerota archaeon]MDG7023105.1 hypothetical protein [Nitrososphaerota archaeon]
MAETYIDSNVSFYAKTGDRVYGKSCGEVARMISSGEIEGATSTLIPLVASSAMRKFGLGREAASEVGAVPSLGMEVFPLEAIEMEEAAGSLEGISTRGWVYAAGLLLGSVFAMASMVAVSKGAGQPTMQEQLQGPAGLWFRERSGLSPSGIRPPAR